MHPGVQDLPDLTGHAPADHGRRGGIGYGERARLEAVDAGARGPGPALERGGQLGAQGRCDPVPLPGLEPVQDQFVDDHLDAAGPGAHAQPAISASLSGRSSLAYSATAALSTSRMPTGTPASAAVNAACRAIARMFPPATDS